ncbi:aldolase [Nonomuraea monospora]|uniref:Aldolase n=1 Tax=Nonomuraea monospora TaxID=568818 RepID=A0ABP5P6R8_9ACTN
MTAQHTTTTPAPTLDLLARPSGGFAMVAMDQRESLRQMFAAALGERVGDERLTSFKLAVAREVGPYASGFLIDQDYGFGQVAAQRMVSGGLIVAVDRLEQEPDGPVEDTGIDERVDLVAAREAGAVAAKLLLIWRDDERRGRRLEIAAEFVQRCADAGLLSVLEGVAKPPIGTTAFDGPAAIREAARELAGLRPSLYKAQVPLGGAAPEERLVEECARLDEVIPVPWVVLSQGVERDDFPAAVRAACRAGASGMLAGRAIWSDVVGCEDVAAELRSRSVPRLRELAAIVDEHARPWTAR